MVNCNSIGDKACQFNILKIFPVSCSDSERNDNDKSQDQLKQLATVVRSIDFFTTQPVKIFIVTNRNWIFEEIRTTVLPLKNTK